MLSLLRVLKCTLLLASLCVAPLLWSQTKYSFQGVVTSTTSSYFTVGETVGFSYTLLSDTPNFTFMGMNEFAADGSFSLNGSTIFSYSGMAGISNFGTMTTDIPSGGTQTGLYNTSCNLNLGAPTHLNTLQYSFSADPSKGLFDSNALPIAGQSITNFDYHSGYLIDDTVNSSTVITNSDFSAGVALYDITSYTVVSAVPEPSFYALSAAAMALGFAAIRRRKNAPKAG